MARHCLHLRVCYAAATEVGVGEGAPRVELDVPPVGFLAGDTNLGQGLVERIKHAVAVDWARSSALADDVALPQAPGDDNVEDEERNRDVVDSLGLCLVRSVLDVPPAVNVDVIGEQLRPFQVQALAYSVGSNACQEVHRVADNVAAPHFFDRLPEGASLSRQ